MRHLLLIFIKAYQYLISPLLGQRCRFYPSCSHYAHDAVKSHGAIKGSWLTAKRLCKCHPWHEGGVDPVPPVKNTDKTQKIQGYTNNINE